MDVCNDGRMDTGTHLRAIWRRRWVVLAAATTLALLVLVLRMAQAPAYTTSSDLFLVLAQDGSDSSATTDRLTASYSGFLRDPRVVADIAARSDLALSERQVRQQVDVTSPESGQLTVTSYASTSVRSVALTNAAAAALSAAADANETEVVKRQLLPLDNDIADLTRRIEELGPDDPGVAPLNAQLDNASTARANLQISDRNRLDVVRPAEALDATRSPNPLRDAVLAFLLGLIVAAEVAALVSARRRGVEGRDPVPLLEAWSALPVFRVGPNRYGPDEAAAALRFLRADRAEAAPVYVVPVHEGKITEVTVGELLDVLVAGGERPTWLQLSPDREIEPPPGVTLLPPATSGQALRSPTGSILLVSAPAWEDAHLLSLAEQTPGPCALVVDAARIRQPDLLEALRVLGYADLAPTLLLVVESTLVKTSGKRRSRSRVDSTTDPKQRGGTRTVVGADPATAPAAPSSKRLSILRSTSTRAQDR